MYVFFICTLRIIYYFISGFISDIQPLWKFPRKQKLKFFNFSFILQNHGFCSDAKNPSRYTIFALSTPPGVSAIAVIRISGPNASDVLFKMGKIKKLPEARKASLCRINDPVSDELLDKALVLWFPCMFFMKKFSFNFY